MNSPDQPERDGAGGDRAEAAPARAPRSRKSARARIHPVADPDAWRDAVLPDPEPPRDLDQGNE